MACMRVLLKNLAQTAVVAVSHPIGYGLFLIILPVLACHADCRSRQPFDHHGRLKGRGLLR